MSKPIVLSEEDWAALHERLLQDYPRSVMLLRDRTKSVLGFSVRRHQEWLGSYNDASPENRRRGHYGYRETVRLDFYNEPKRTMFLLKYSEYLDKSRVIES